MVFFFLLNWNIVSIDPYLKNLPIPVAVHLSENTQIICLTVIV